MYSPIDDISQQVSIPQLSFRWLETYYMQEKLFLFSPQNIWDNDQVSVFLIKLLGSRVLLSGMHQCKYWQRADG
jgi:hypothetical protein